MSYITKDELKKYMGVNFTPSLDSFVDLVIKGCEEHIEEVCGSPYFGNRKFKAPEPNTASVRRFNGSGDTKLYVGDLFDIESITIDDSEYILDEDIFAYPLNKENRAYHWLEINQLYKKTNSRASFSKDSIFKVGQANVQIEGYWYFSETVPSDIKLAVLKLVGGVLKENVSDEDVKEKKSESLGDYKVDFQDLKTLAHTLKVNDLLYPFMMSNDKSGMSGGVGKSSGIIKVN